MRMLPAVVVVLSACGPGAQDSGRGVAVGTSGTVRATRRAYDGAPPTVPHPDPGASCSACHDADGQAVGAGVAPASPHVGTAQVGGTERCRQCHVFVATDALFVPTRFIGLPQNLRAGSRATPGAPPTIPHRLLMRENCAACHAGQGIREEIRTSHPERQRCRQCHVPATMAETYRSVLGVAPEGGARP
ncbi:MAG: nitrate reductase cytochrome c-type subunit [Gemmatimonadota bacterium]|nr:nitrate reductase cytochrome c-type subunit [Gemmatimonadota bacterium]MDH4350466.1 nitrate reductase cytochrome c-type subunit [Gemmatimonadota bacterium]MDH5196833.1 nitrate reductase cytochrome c-type subunit [Gemmatimonadota bacterium]